MLQNDAILHFNTEMPELSGGKVRITRSKDLVVWFGRIQGPNAGGQSGRGKTRWKCQSYARKVCRLTFGLWTSIVLPGKIVVLRLAQRYQELGGWCPYSPCMPLSCVADFRCARLHAIGHELLGRLCVDLTLRPDAIFVGKHLGQCREGGRTIAFPCIA